MQINLDYKIYSKYIFCNCFSAQSNRRTFSSFQIELPSPPFLMRHHLRLNTFPCLLFLSVIVGWYAPWYLFMVASFVTVGWGSPTLFSENVWFVYFEMWHILMTWLCYYTNLVSDFFIGRNYRIFCLMIIMMYLVAYVFNQTVLIWHDLHGNQWGRISLSQ